MSLRRPRGRPKKRGAETNYKAVCPGGAACTRQLRCANRFTPKSADGPAESVQAAYSWPDATTRSPSYPLHPG